MHIFEQNSSETSSKAEGWPKISAVFVVLISFCYQVYFLKIMVN